MEGRPRFGDEQSSLLDQFERLSFEIHLNQAILGRSWSESNVGRPYYPFVSQVQHRQRSRGLSKVLKRLLKPLVCRKGGRQESASNGPLGCKILSRSLRV
ncbi:hypothetical protein ACHQM5_020660 [Ranunculus cassubicifolius]